MKDGKSKRRGHNEGSIRKRPDGTWEARLSLPNGKRKSFYSKTRREVQNKLREAQRELENGLDLTVRRQTVGQFLDRWLADVVKPSNRPKTHKSYEQLVRLHLKPELGHIPLTQLTPQHVQAMITKKTASGLSPRTVQYIRAVLRSALGRAMKWGQVTRNVATLVDPPRSVRNPVQPLTPEQAQQFIAATKEDRLGPLFHIAIMTGLRQGELFGLRWEDVNLDEKFLTVRYALQRIEGKLQFVEPKTQLSRRTVYLTASAVTAFRNQRMRQLQERLMAGAKWNEWGLVFASSVGTPLEPSNVTKRLHELLEDSGLPRQRFHDLRHCTGSLMLASGATPREIMGVLGHSQISLTMNTYAHLSPALERAAMDRLEDLMTVS